MKINAKILNDLVTPEMLQPRTPGSAGIDLMAVNFGCEDMRELYLYPNDCVKIGTGISIHIDNPCYAGIIIPRSGTGHNKGLILGNLIGLIDEAKIFNSAIPASQIKEQYCSGLNSLLINGSITQEEYLSRLNNYAQN